MAGWIWPARHFARAGGRQRQALRAFAVHTQGKLLHVQHDIGDVFPHALDAGEFMQHAVDLHSGHRGALQRGQQHAAQRVAKGHAEAALQRLGDDGRDTRRDRRPVRRPASPA